MPQHWIAQRFDGRQPCGLWQRLTLLDEPGGALLIEPGGERLPLALLDADGDGRLFQLPDGSSLQIEGPLAPWVAALRAAGWRQAPVQRWQPSWWPAIAALLLLGAYLLAMDRRGLPWLGEQLAQQVPHAWQDKLGQEALQLFSSTSLTWTELASPRWRQLQAQMTDRFAHAEPGLLFRLHGYETHGEPEPNAFALPGGHIVVLEGLLKLMDDEQVMAVVAHEMGHAYYRHPMQGVGRAAGLGMLASLTMGDYSSVASTTVGSVAGLRHSREMEAQADAYALQLLQRLQIRPAKLAEAFEILQQYIKASGVEAEGQLPQWLNSHPDLEARIAMARRADAALPAAAQPTTPASAP